MIENVHIKEIAEGNSKTLSKLYDEWYKRFFYYTFKLTHEKELSEDLVQEAFVLYWNNRRDFTDVLAVKTYFYLTLRNKILSHFRDSSIHKRILNSIVDSNVIEDGNLLIVADVCGEVQQAIATLPQQTQNVIRMSMLDMKLEEIASELNISVNTVKTLKKNAYKYLRQRLNYLKSFVFFLFFF